MVPVSKTELVDGNIQKSINFSERNAKIKIKLKKKRPAGTYSIWNCIRFSIEPGWTRVFLELPQGGSEEFHWTFAYEDYYKRLRHQMGKEFDSLNYKTRICNDKLAELAGTVILPDPSAEFFSDMVKILCGINNNTHYLNDNNSFK